LGPSSILSNEYHGLFLRGESSGSWSWPFTSN
jgi:hypothetical protein